MNPGEAGTEAEPDLGGRENNLLLVSTPFESSVFVCFFRCIYLKWFSVANTAQGQMGSKRELFPTHYQRSKYEHGQYEWWCKEDLSQCHEERYFRKLEESNKSCETNQLIPKGRESLLVFLT